MRHALAILERAWMEELTRSAEFHDAGRTESRKQSLAVAKDCEDAIAIIRTVTFTSPRFTYTSC